MTTATKTVSLNDFLNANEFVLIFGVSVARPTGEELAYGLDSAPDTLGPERYDADGDPLPDCGHAKGEVVDGTWSWDGEGDFAIDGSTLLNLQAFVNRESWLRQALDYATEGDSRRAPVVEYLSQFVPEAEAAKLYDEYAARMGWKDDSEDEED